MTSFLSTKSEEETIALGRLLGSLLEPGDIVLLDGDLGAGKTRFSKGVAQGLGIKTEITSPTFNLVLEYPVPSANDAAVSAVSIRVLRHFDLYRLDEAEQLDDLDYFGLIEQDDAVSLVEWGSKFDELPLGYLQIIMSVDEINPEQRRLELIATGSRAAELLETLINFKQRPSSEKAEEAKHG